MFADKIETPPTTMSNWFKWEDIPLDNIRRCCDALGIKLWEFFWEESEEIPDYVRLGIGKEDLKLVRKLNEKLSPDENEKILSLINGFVDLIRR